MARLWLTLLTALARVSLLPWLPFCWFLYVGDGELPDYNPWRHRLFWYVASYPLWAGAFLAGAWRLVSRAPVAAVALSLLLPLVLLAFFGPWSP